MKTIHLFGDSVSRGYALGQFADGIPPSNSLYVFRAPWATANALFDDNGVPARMIYQGSCIGVPTTPARITALIDSYAIAAGDVIAFEDAGDHSENPDQYEAEWTALLQAASAHPHIGVIAKTTYDYGPAPSNSQFDLPFVGTPSNTTRTMNDAIRAAVASVAGVTLIDMNAIADNFRLYTLGQTGTDIIRADGIHPNLYLQSLDVGETLKACGLTTYLRSLLSVTEIARANYQALSYGAIYWGDNWPAVFLTAALIR